LHILGLMGTELIWAASRLIIWQGSTVLHLRDFAHQNKNHPTSDKINNPTKDYFKKGASKPKSGDSNLRSGDSKPYFSYSNRYSQSPELRFVQHHPVDIC
jgi:hypothetical protein